MLLKHAIFAAICPQFYDDLHSSPQDLLVYFRNLFAEHFDNIVTTTDRIRVVYSTIQHRYSHIPRMSVGPDLPCTDMQT